jgi:hypothetical protein
MNATNNIATDLFYKVRSRFRGLKLGDETGQLTINPEQARFFDFDYMEGETPIGHVSISLAEENSMKVYFSNGITESMDGKQKDHWYDFLKELRTFAKRRLMAFDTRDIAKDNLDKRDYEFLSQHNKPKEQPNTIVQPVGEQVMNESTLYGTKTMSYQKLMDTRLIIKHSQAVMDDTQPGARTRHISALFVENQDGERFKYPFIHLAGARAMQRHVANGGLPYDDLGKSIIQMSEEIAQLKSFGNYVVRNDLMNSDTNGIVERSTQALNDLRETIQKIAKQGHYEAYKESFQAREQIEVPQEVAEEYTEKFTVKNFKEDIKSVFPVIYRLMQEESSIGYDDIVAMTREDMVNDEVDVVENDEDNYFDKFESWVMGLGEESAITSSDQEEQAQAVKELQELVGEHFPAGVDGSNAIESLKGIIEDPKLYKEIKDQAKEDPDSCVRPLIKNWLEQNAPEIVDQLDFGDMVDEPAADQGGDQTAPEEEPQMAGDDPDKRNDDKDDLPFEPDENPSDKDEFGNTIKHRARHLAKKGMRQAMDVKGLAEFIGSFYDRNTGTFPKGPEGVVVMVGKKFGEQAEQVARKFVERMAPHQEAGAEQMQELARIRELAGMPGSDLEEKRYEFHQRREGVDEGSLEEVSLDLAKRARDKAEYFVDMDYDDMRDRPYGYSEKQRSKFQRYIDKKEPRAKGDRDWDPPKKGAAEGTLSGTYYYEKLAQKVFDENPNLDTSGRAREVMDAGFKIAVADLGKKQAQGLFGYDEDFPSDFVSAYSELKRGSNEESVSPELEDIRRLSGIAQGLGL